MTDRAAGDAVQTAATDAVARPEPRVDVGIPTHGQPRYLRATLESVLEQTFDRWRLTISENGEGGDEIREIVEPYLSDPRITHVATGAPIHRTENQTRAIGAGTAPFVAVLHDDDRWGPDFLARRVAFLEAHPSCGLVFSNCNFFGEGDDDMFGLKVRLREGIQPRETFLRALYRRNIIAMPTVLVRRSAYDSVGADFTTSVLFSDYEMWMRIAARFDVGFLDVSDAYYRIHAAQITHSANPRLGEHRLEVLDEMDKWLPPDFPPMERRRGRSGAYLRASYDAFERRDRRTGLAHIARALRTYPVAFADPEILSMAAGSLRYRVHQRRLWRAAKHHAGGS